MTIDYMSLEEIADRIDPRAAQLAVAKICAEIAADRGSNGDTVDAVVDAIEELHSRSGLPAIKNPTEAEYEFWEPHL
ncbi:Uncharacterised protein [Mycobacteroides abscessus subsp. abscessus]|uniref:hypothetical protein n=1 Tax=Mycobacteroides abscessus TaxID=36809 RepID=UPI0009270DA4|nr:hypothetical protein [Mycobacteroides abscessus]SIH21513.1 Uncharacterised protein [Mycobacteroides abscessus subsp. abscessus]